MRGADAISFVVAVLFHGLVLFGLHLKTQAVPLKAGDTPSVDVALVADATAPSESAPAPAAPLPAPAPAEEPPDDSESSDTEVAPPEPQATPAPTPIAIPPEPVAAPTATPQPTSTPSPPVHRTPKHPTPSVSNRSVRTGSVPPPVSRNGTAPPAGAATGAPSGQPVRYRYNPKPEYPAEARANRQEGVVVLSVNVGADGRPELVSLKRSSGFPLLDQAAIAAVKRWAFQPARAASIPIASEVDVPVRFSLQP